jgi:hypothetical protein
LRGAQSSRQSLDRPAAERTSNFNGLIRFGRANADSAPAGGPKRLFALYGAQKKTARSRGPFVFAISPGLS